MQASTAFGLQYYWSVSPSNCTGAASHTHVSMLKPLVLKLVPLLQAITAEKFSTRQMAMAMAMQPHRQPSTSHQTEQPWCVQPLINSVNALHFRKHWQHRRVPTRRHNTLLRTLQLLQYRLPHAPIWQPVENQATSQLKYRDTSELIVASKCGAPPLSMYRHRAAKQPAHLQGWHK